MGLTSSLLEMVSAYDQKTDSRVETGFEQFITKGYVSRTEEEKDKVPITQLLIFWILGLINRLC